MNIEFLEYADKNGYKPNSVVWIAAKNAWLESSRRQERKTYIKCCDTIKSNIYIGDDIDPYDEIQNGILRHIYNEILSQINE